METQAETPLGPNTQCVATAGSSKRGPEGEGEGTREESEGEREWRRGGGRTTRRGGGGGRTYGRENAKGEARGRTA